MSQLLGPMAQNERGWELIREARLLLSRVWEEQRGSLAGARIKYGTVLGLAQDREDVAERKKRKSLFDATAGHPYVTASEVQTSRTRRRRKMRGCWYCTDKSRRGEKNKAQGR